MSWGLTNPGVIDVQSSHKRACQPGDDGIFAGEKGGEGRGGVGRYGVASWNWMIRALTVQTGVQDQQPASRTGLATNGLAKN